MVLKQEEVLYQDGYDIGIGVSMATGTPLLCYSIHYTEVGRRRTELRF